ncbi:MAG: NUDIX domain-containing protein [Alphaproteobacteria bacterium]|nr:NUDIX domain-containing protein [Alphaproteobacteria bacterium]
MKSSGLVTKTLQYYWRTTRALTIGAQGCVLTDDGKILLIRHTYRPGWHFPGGGVEKNETIQAALERELFEEARVQLTAPPVLFGLYANFQFFPGDHIALFAIREWRQTEPPKPNREIADHGFFAPDDLPVDIHPPTRDRIDEVISGVRTSDLWS